MIKPVKLFDVTIDNYKNFSHFQFSNLARINVITGKNNSGKTSLLEALFLCLGPTNPDLLVSLLGRRGQLTSLSSANYFFHELNFSNRIKITFKTDQANEYTLKIQNVESKSYSVSKKNTKEEQSTSGLQLINSSAPKEISLILTFPSKKTNIAKATFSSGQIAFSKEQGAIFCESVFLSSIQSFSNPNLDASRYSSLDRQDRIPEFNKYLKYIEPDIKRTSLISENDSTFIAGDVGYGLVPLSLLGEGMNKFASIILAISQSKDAVCLIDEIENGFHYSMYPKLWEVINEISIENNCQVFCTTHSLECIKGCYGLLENNEDTIINLHRIDKKDHKNSLITYTQNEIKSAVELDWEVR